MKGYNKVFQVSKRCLFSLVLGSLLVYLLLPTGAPSINATQELPNSRGSSSMTFYPDNDPESSTVDGFVRRNLYPSGESWSSLRSGAGHLAYDSSAYGEAINILADYNVTSWGLLTRSIYLFDTSALPDNAIIQSATLSLRGYDKTDIPGIAPDINIYSASPASNTALVASDYNIGNFGSTPFSTAITYAAFSTSGYNDFALNSAGIAAISLTGISKFGARNANYDVANVAPSLVDNEYSWLRVYFAEQGADYAPKLVVTYTLPSELTMTFYPDADPENSSVDGHVQQIVPSGTTWSGIRDGAGTEAVDNGYEATIVDIYARDSSNEWTNMSRGIFLFDTSALPDNATITSANLSFYGSIKYDNANWQPNVNIYGSNPASNTALAAGDFDSLGSTAFCDTPISYSSFSTSGYNDFSLNESGIAAISLTGVSKFGARNANYDAANSTPTWGNSYRALLAVCSAEKGTGYKPKLVVSYTLPEEYSMTFYPDADPESSTVDGFVRRNLYPNGESWSSLRSGNGTIAYDSGAYGEAINILADYYATSWGLLSRSIYLFDTSALPDNAVIQSATLSLYGYDKTDIPGIAPDINIYSASPASDNVLAASDYNIGNFGSTPFSTAISYLWFSTTGYNDFTLNEAGIAAISLTGISKFGARNANYDVANVAPSLVDNEYSWLRVYFAEQGEDYAPKLEVTYTIPDIESMTFYPDADPESSTVDGFVRRNLYPNGESWSSLRSGAGHIAYDSGAYGEAINILADYYATSWGLLSRSIYLFDTSALPDNAVIQSATLSLYGYDKTDIPGIAPDINIYSASPASNTALVASDYNIGNFGSTPFSTAITYAAFSTTGYNDFPLNSAGIAAISLTGISKFGARNANYDVANVAPSLVDNEYSWLRVYFAEQGAGYKPKLVVTYYIP